MKNIHVLPSTPNDETAKGIWIKETRDWCNIYITNDEEIKDGDWWLNRDDNKIYHNVFWQLANNAPSCKKIILTTDYELIADGVQALEYEFLEWFEKNGSCESVDVETCISPMGVAYKIIIPKEQISEEAKRRAKSTMGLKDVQDVESSVEWLFKQLWETPKDKLNWNSLLEKAEEKHKKELIEFAKLHCKAQLKAILKNVQMTGIAYGNDKSITDYEVDKDSIKGAYPLDLIK